MDGHHEPVTLDEDLNIVLRVTDLESKRRFTVSYDGGSSYKEYDLSELVLTPAPAADPVPAADPTPEAPENNSEEVAG